MSAQSEKNAEIIHHLSQFRDTNTIGRFVLYGSLARGVLLGNDVADLHDPRGRRFQDVDVLDRTTTLTRQYRFLEGTLDVQALKVTRPLPHNPGTWGFFDPLEPIDPETTPLSMFDEAELGLTEKHFSRIYPTETILVPNAVAMLALSNFFAYAYEMPKHFDQLSALEDQAPDYRNSAIWEARDKFIADMSLRYPLSFYGQARKRLFSIAPSLALGIQKGAGGKIIRAIRGVSAPEDEALTLEDLSVEPKTSP